MNNNVLKFINVLESWKTAIKNLHWSANSLSQHQLCDDIASEIAEFQDTVSEVEQGINGKIGLNKLNPTHYTIKSLKQFIQDIISETTSFYKGLEGDTYIGMRSDCESFLSTMQKHLYLVNFTLKEDLKRRMQALNENKYIVIEGKNGSVKMTDKQFKSFLTEEIEKRLFVNEIREWDTDALQRDYDRAKKTESIDDSIDCVESSFLTI